MTERLYYTTDATEGRAQILRCEPDAEGRYAVELDRTLFHPQGGGQPADCGWIAGVAVESVVTRDDHVVHILSQPLLPGEVSIEVDATARSLHSRLHSAGHMIGQAGEQLGWQPVKAHHWPGEGRITFVAKENAALPEASALQAKIDGWISEDLPRRLSMEEGLRKVGFGEQPAYPCGGTHVASLSALGEVVITQLKLKKGQMVVSYTLR
ncbi:alanyl-tRNA editing protein [Scandinavium goeteborgense]|uniref:alanyl-tRNA editing protein n=1 Tax=Scandinavium goeteborgense TaxID=1851514 RepID=UPI000F67C76D|nr:alanyl-tRNA editing protein [Scandinavium goeteborgense]QKN83353.1 alanyl-tRNA editing protein [Scandinavium goeteborgense]